MNKFKIGLSNVDLGLSESVKVVVDTPEYLVVEASDGSDGEWWLYPAGFDAEYDNPITIKAAKIYNPARPDVATAILRYSSPAAAINAIEGLIEDGVIPDTVRMFNSDGSVTYRLNGSNVIRVLVNKNSGRGRSSNPETPIWFVLRIAAKDVSNIAEHIRNTYGYDPVPVKLSEFSRRKEKEQN